MACQFMIIPFPAFAFIQRLKENFGNFFYPHNPEQLSYIINTSVIQNKLHQHLVADIFLFIFGNIPEQGAVFPDKSFYFRAVHF